jgi:hypothetical protein
MFKLSKNPTYFEPVEVTLVGGTKKLKFEIEFKRLKSSEIKEILAQIGAETITDAELLARLVAGWKNLKDCDDDEIQFSIDALEAIADEPRVGKAIVNAFFSSISEARQKN